MKTLCRILLLVALAMGIASAQTTIQVVPAVPVVAGQAACLGTYQGSVPGYVPCDNTATTPTAAVGVWITAGHPQTRGVPGSAQPAMMALNGQITIPIPVFGQGLCAVGDLVGDIDGSGNINTLGPPGTIVLGSFSESYIGICVGPNAALTQLTLIVEPGYIFDPATTGHRRR